MPLGRHKYNGKNPGKISRFLSKLTTCRERRQMRKLKYAYKKIEKEKSANNNIAQKAVR